MPSFSGQFYSALRYEQYLVTGTNNNSDAGRRSMTSHSSIRPQELIAGFQREMKILVHSGSWCGDCVGQCPLIQRIADANPAKIDLRFLECEMNRELNEELRINGGSLVPVVQFFSEDGLWCATAADRALNRYRAPALKRLGSRCPTGILPPEKGEVEATLADCLNEVGRVQLMPRLTPRLDEKHKD
jgi:thiol-disulfide isomerase/thioredoxin